MRLSPEKGLENYNWISLPNTKWAPLNRIISAPYIKLNPLDSKIELSSILSIDDLPFFNNGFYCRTIEKVLLAVIIGWSCDNDKISIFMNDQNESFVTDHEDTYKAVYYVEPQTTDHPTYQINRKIIVKDTRDKSVFSTEVSQSETETENQSDSGGGGKESGCGR